MRVRNPLILNGIDFDPVFADLRDRCLFIRLKQPKVRKSRHELEEKFEAIRPLILGALLDAVVAALSNTKYRLDRDIGFRMLDAAEFAMRAADAGALPFTETELRESLEARNREVKADELLNDPVARAVFEIAEEKLPQNMNDEHRFEIYSSDLWEDVVAKAKSYAKMPKDVPNSASSFVKYLSAIKGLLKINGLSVSSEHTRDGTKISLEKLSQDVAKAESSNSNDVPTSETVPTEISDSTNAEDEGSSSSESQ